MSILPLRAVGKTCRAALTACLLTLLVVGCRPASGIVEKMDATSRRRLAAIPPEHTVLVSMRVSPAPARIPPLGERGRILARSKGALLIEILPSEANRLAKVNRLDRVAVWGDGDVAGKLDPRLRVSVLEAWAEDIAGPLPMIAQFRAGTTDARRVVESTGAAARSAVGPVVTFDALPDQVFDLLASPELLSLKKPVLLRPISTP